MDKRTKIWRAMVALVILTALSYYTLVVNNQITEPALAGMSFEFWFGIFTTAVLVLATFISKSFFPGKED